MRACVRACDIDRADTLGCSGARCARPLIGWRGPVGRGDWPVRCESASHGTLCAAIGRTAFRCLGWLFCAIPVHERLMRATRVR